MNLKLFLKSFISLILVVFVLIIFAGCKEDELSKLFEEGELPDFFDLQKDNAVIVDDHPGKSYGEDEIHDDDTLNMDAVKRLAYGDIDPFDFMDKFPGITEGSDPIVYTVHMPNNYAVSIEYSGGTVNFIYLEDRELETRLNLGTQKIEIDEFLLERAPD